MVHVNGAFHKTTERTLRAERQAVLESINVSRSYKSGENIVVALDNVSFSIRQGEFVAIMGPSGSGKSTLLNLLGALDYPSSGEILLAKRPLSKLDDTAITLMRRQHIGFIFQSFNLIPTLTAAENVGLPLMIGGKNLALYQQKISTLLEKVGLANRGHHKPDELSGGQQQRVAIARALITEPAIVLADEPTGNLDSKTSGEILQLLRRSCDEMSQAIVVVTHDPKAASYADRVIFLKDGRIADELNGSGKLGVDQILARFSKLEAL